MKKSQTNYYVNIWKWDCRDNIQIEVSEEVENHMRVKTYDERRRSKEEHIKFFKAIVKELEAFNP